MTGALQEEDYTGAGSDLHLLPALGAAVVFIYNVPEIVGLPPLLLSRSVCVGVYLGLISSWRDPAILALNPAHAVDHLSTIA
jgi:ABC-type phosphate transport system substrate-binding protein